MYIIENMDFYVKITKAVPDDEDNEAQKIEYVKDFSEATMYNSVSEAANTAEELSISAFSIKKV